MVDHSRQGKTREGMEKRGAEGRRGRSLSEVPRHDWDEHLDDYVNFVKEHNRIPSQNAEDSGERRLTFWLRHQKESLRNGLLLPERVEKLERLLPGWSSPYRVRTSWDDMLARAVQFKADRGRHPSTKSSDAYERSLANWLYRQRVTPTASKAGRSAERMVKLKEALPGWPLRRSDGEAER